MIYLLVAFAHSSPDMGETTIGVQTPFTEYVKFIADERTLPTMWTEEQRACLWGTSLERHVGAKIRSLETEYSTFCDASKNISWAREWWGEAGCLSIDDWKVADAMYRSRAMDFEAHGLCLVPVLDMANHKLEDASNAMYWVEGTSKEAYMYLDGKDRVNAGEEVTITYGLHKGASEMTFSYGFIDEGIQDAYALMMGWSPPADDDLKEAKMAALNLEPGFEIYRPRRSVTFVEWASPCIWAMSVNQEDGLTIRSHQQDSGEQTLQVWFKDKHITSKDELRHCLQRDRMAEIFRLRAYSYVDARLKAEIVERQRLNDRDESEKVPRGIDPEASPEWAIAERLRDLEMRLLCQAHNQFQSNIEWLVDRQDVKDYLEGIPLAPKPTYVQWEERPEDHAWKDGGQDVANFAELLRSLGDSDENTWQEEIEGSEHSVERDAMEDEILEDSLSMRSEEQ